MKTAKDCFKMMYNIEDRVRCRCRILGDVECDFNADCRKCMIPVVKKLDSIDRTVMDCLME